MIHVFRAQSSLAAAGLLLVVSVSPSFAQGEATIRGQAVAAATRVPLDGVTVTLTPVPPGESAKQTTDADGRFSFQGIRPGEYVLSTARDGFVPRAERFIVAPREMKTVALSLELRQIEIGVEVTGEGPALPSTHSPSSTVLRAQHLEELPAAQRASLPDAIVTLAPGMIRGHDDFVHIRGHEIALNPFINGVSFWENPHTVFSSGVNPEVIETANVMTGGFPAEYGNRFGGVVDIVTKSGLSMRNSGAVSFGGGEAGRRNASAEFGGHTGRFGYYLFGNGVESDRFLSPPDPRAIHDDGRAGHLFGQLDAEMGHMGALRVVLIGDGSNFQIPKTPQDVELRPLANAGQRTRQQTAIAGWTRAWPAVAADASFYQRWSSARLSPAAGPLTATASVDRELLTIGGKVNVTRFAGRHAIKGGIDTVLLKPREDLAYNYNGYRELTHLLGLPHIHIEANAIDFSGDESGGQISAYVQDAVQLGARVKADIGIRVDRYDLLVSATHASPRVNLAVQMGGGATLHASYNHFFVPPPIEGVLSSSAGLTAAIREIGVALPALEPSTENQLELGASAPVGPMRLAITGYYRTTDNPVHTTVWPDSRIYSYASFDKERAYGMETKVDLPMLTRYGVSGFLNYALGRVNFYNPVTGGFATEAEHITETDRFLAPMDQRHTFTAGATYRHSRTGIWAGTTLEYGSGTPIGHGGSHEHAAGEADHADAEAAGAAERVPGHFVANLSVGIDLLRASPRRPRLSLQIDVENLTDNLYRIAQDNEFSPGQFSIPRLVSGSVKVRF